MRTGIYARVSTQRQAQADGMAQQLDRLQAHALRQGWTVRAEHIFRDDGYSGARLKRPGLERHGSLPKAQPPGIAQAPVPPTAHNSGETGALAGKTGAEGASSASRRRQTLRQKDRGASFPRRTPRIRMTSCPTPHRTARPRTARLRAARPRSATSSTTPPSSSVTSAPTTPRSRTCSR